MKKQNHNKTAEESTWMLHAFNETAAEVVESTESYQANSHAHEPLKAGKNVSSALQHMI